MTKSEQARADAMADAGKWHYFRAGDVERGSRYQWRTGYARVVEDGIIYPWLTKREAQTSARAAGKRAVFHENEAAARAAFRAVPGLRGDK